ncbi:MAG: hypothetical protein WAM61_17530 [Desulfobacterales bacterium]
MRRRLSTLAAVVMILLGTSGRSFAEWTATRVLQETMASEPAAFFPNGIQEAPVLVAQSGQSDICKTPVMACKLPESGSIGSACWCVGPSGPVKGVIAAN